MKLPRKLLEFVERRLAARSAVARPRAAPRGSSDLPADLRAGADRH